MPRPIVALLAPLGGLLLAVAPTPMPRASGPAVPGPVVVPAFPSPAPAPSGVHLEGVRIYTPQTLARTPRRRPPAALRAEREAYGTTAANAAAARDERLARSARLARYAKAWRSDRRITSVPLRVRP